MSRGADALQTHAEILKLARMLEREPDELAYLETVGVADVRALREQIIAALWSADNESLSRLAAASKLLPVPIIATIAQRAFGPLLSARMAGLLEPSRAVDIAGRLPIDFLADLAVELDPRRAAAVLVRIEPDRIGAITRVLVARGEDVAMGRFVGHLGEDAIRAALAEMDDATLLRVGFVLEDKDRLPLIVSLLAPERLKRLIAAAAKQELWVQALDLLGHLSPEQRAVIIDGAVPLDPTALEAIAGTVIAHELWDEALVIAEGDPALQSSLAARISGLPARQRRTLAKRAAQEGAIGRLGPLGEALAL